MSLTPYLLQNLLFDDYAPRSRLMDQHFGLGLLPEELLEPITVASIVPRPHSHGYYRPWRTSQSTRDLGSTLKSDKDKFQVSLDVQQFKPEEISVKMLDDENAVVIEGKHEEKQDEHGFISRHFVRRYVLPKDVDVKQLGSNLSSDGVLTISAPKLSAIENQAERNIPITHTGPIRQAVQQQASTEQNGASK